MGFGTRKGGWEIVVSFLGGLAGGAVFFQLGICNLVA